jgi:carboxylesterase type B
MCSSGGSQLFQFAVEPSADPMNGAAYCKGYSCHGAELAFVFHSQSIVHEFDPSYSWDPIQRNLSWACMDYWKAFAHGRSEISPVSCKLASGCPAWPAPPQVLSFDHSGISVLPDFRAKRCAFWDEYEHEGRRKVTMSQN